MERFVFVAAVTIAIIFGVSQIFGGHSLTIDVDDFDGGGTDPVVELSAGRLEPQSFTATHIDVKHAALLVVITPEDRADISVEIDNPGHVPMPELRLDDETLVIDGGLRNRISNCGEDQVELRGYGTVARSDLPRVVIHAPRTLNLEVGGASSAEIGPSQALEASFSGCGGAQIGDVAELLDIDLSGSGEIHAGAARRLNADVAGSGSLEAGGIGESADIDIAGSGEVGLATLSGTLTLDSAGAGNLNVRGGALTEVKIDLAGSGDVNIAAPVQSLNVSIVGSGDVDVAGVVGDIDADIAGSGGVSAQSVTGAVTKEVWGSGDVRIGG